MNPIYSVYKVVSSGLFLLGFPPFLAYSFLSGRYQRGLKERIGLVSRAVLRGTEGSPRIWIHAVSLGEVKAAIPVIGSLKEMLPGCSISLSTTTEQGYSLAKSDLEGIPVFYAPIDVGFSVTRALSRVRPDIVAFVETELWPAWILGAESMGIKSVLINGRISPRSIGAYLKLRPLFRHVLDKVVAFSMISAQDASRIIRLGADPGRVRVNGNSKYELLARMTRPGIEKEMRRLLNLQSCQRVLIGGSLRRGEESFILDVYRELAKRYPDMVLVMAPRHIGRTEVIESFLRSNGLGYQMRTELEKPGIKRTEPVIIMNNFGELFKLYSVGDIIFCGGSIVQAGGQNPLEAAAWGKVVFYGPSMDDFTDAREILEDVGAGIVVSGAGEFCEKAAWLLDRPDILARRGIGARDAVIRLQGAAQRHAKIIADELEGNNFKE